MEHKAGSQMKSTPKKEVKGLEGKKFLFIHGTRGLSQEHADGLAAKIRTFGGNTENPELSMLFLLP